MVMISITAICLIGYVLIIINPMKAIDAFAVLCVTLFFLHLVND